MSIEALYNQLLKMQNHIVQLIKLSFVPDSQTLRNVSTQIEELAKQEGFCPTMMAIADNPAFELPIRQAALVQMKIAVKKYWDSTAFTISVADKNQIANTLIDAIIRVSQIQLLLRIYKQITTLIIGFEHRNWMPVPALLEKLKANQDVVPVFEILLAISTNFEFCISDEQRSSYYQYLHSILPTLYEYVQHNHNEEVIYLSLKIIWKAVHYEISHDVRTMLCNWMDLILAISGATNPQLEANIEETQDKGTPEFYYFHAKKWATRVLYRFISRHANPNQSPMASEAIRHQNKQFSKAWYDSFGNKVVETVTNQFMIPSIKKTRFFQIKCLSGIIAQHPNVMKNYAKKFQYEILPTYMQLHPEDEEIANNDPIQFMNREEDGSFNYSNLKKVAVEAWVAFSNIGSKRKGPDRAEQVGVFFYDNMNFLKSKLQGGNPLEKQMAMYLICQLRLTINSCQEIRKIIPELVSQYVIPEFTNEIMFLRARAMEIFDEYGDLKYDPVIVKKAVEGIYFCLTQDNYPLVRLKAAKAFHVLLRHTEAKEEVRPLFQQILEIYLLLIEKYDMEALVHSLTSIVEHFSLEVSPYSCELMHYLAKHFVKLYQKDSVQSQQNDYDGETELAAAGVLNTMKILLESPIEKESIDKMEDDIGLVCDFIFSAEENTDYIEDAMMVLKAYTHRCSAFSERLLMYYVLSIYYVMGISEQYWPLIPQLSLPEYHKKALNQMKSGCNVQSLESVMPVLRNYISKGSSQLFQTNDPFGINLLELLFQMINQIYSKGPDVFDGEIQMNSCTILMVYLIENNIKKWPESVVNHVWQVAKFNIEKAKSVTLKALNSQLVCVLLWNSPEHIIALAQQNNLMNTILEQIFSSQTKIVEEHQRQRIIFGLCELFMLKNKPAECLPHLVNLFKLLMTLVERNCEVRLNQQDDENYRTDSEEEAEEQQIHNIDDIDEPENMWEQDFERNYSSNLDYLDEIKHFKQTMQKLEGEQSEFCRQLLSMVASEKVVELNAKMEKAIQLCDRPGEE